MSLVKIQIITLLKMTSKGFFTERGFFIFICFLDLFKYSTSYNVSDATYLHNQLFDQSGYRTLVLPDYPVIVSVEYNMLTVNSLDMKSQTLSTSGWFTVVCKYIQGGTLYLTIQGDNSVKSSERFNHIVMVWNDSRLAWNKSSHGNIENIYVSEDSVWHPKLIVQNSIYDLSSLGDGTTVRIRNDGKIRWELPAILSTSCDMDVTIFPFDSQTCDVELASWGFHTDAVNLTFMKTNLDLEDYNINGEWNIVSTSQHASELTEEGLVYSELFFRIVFERLPNYYIMSVIIPVILTAVLTSVTFILPVESGEKVGYILTVLLALAVLLTMFTDSMPTTSKHTSVLVVFLTVTVGLASFVIIVTILIIRLYHEPENYIAPNWMHSLVRRFRKPQNSGVDTNQIDQTEFAENNKLQGSGHRSCKEVSLDNIKTTYTNIELALFFDNFLFFVFTVLYVLITVCFAITLCVAE